MKKLFILIAVLSLTALAPKALAARFYVQPSLAWAKVDRFDAEIGGSLAVGALFAQRHAVEIECSQISFEDSVSEGGFSDELEFKVTPILLSYRYEFPLTQRFFASVGASTGVTLQDYRGRFTYIYPPLPAGTGSGRFGPTGTFSGSFGGDDQAFTAGANMSVGYRFTDRIALIFSAKYLHTTRTDVANSDSFPLVQLSVNSRY